MMVCDICFTPDPICTGSPTVNINEPGKQSRQEYLFGKYKPNGSHEGSTLRIDVCRECLEMLRNRDWDGIAARAQEVLMLRLGVKPHDTSKHDPHCGPQCPDWPGHQKT